MTTPSVQANSGSRSCFLGVSDSEDGDQWRQLQARRVASKGSGFPTPR